MAIKLTPITRTRKQRGTVNSDINVTPLVDVMLVLLIIFMITSPMLVAGINVDLPETTAMPVATTKNEPLVVTISAAGDIFLCDTKINKIHLAEKLKQIAKEKKDTRIFVRGDRKTAYGDIVNMIAEIQSAGFNKVALISNIKDDIQRK